jgi:hypothetical protein
MGSLWSLAVVRAIKKSSSEVTYGQVKVLTPPNEFADIAGEEGIVPAGRAVEGEAS